MACQLKECITLSILAYGSLKTFLGQNMLRAFVVGPEDFWVYISDILSSLLLSSCRHSFVQIPSDPYIWVWVCGMGPPLVWKRTRYILLENIQHFVVKIATKAWNTSSLPPLSTRRTYFKLVCIYLQVFAWMYIYFVLQIFFFTTLTLIYVFHHKQLLQSYAKTVSCYNSFFYKCCKALELIT